MHLSVAICTWNRAALLDQTLEAMAGLHVPPGVDWELVVVNNNSTDDTEAVLGRYAGRLPLRRLFEAAPGKSHAANLAARESRGDLILWTDDDVLVDPDWLGAYAQAARDWPDALFFGGTIEPWFAVEPPAWVRQNLQQLEGVYAILRAGDTTRPLTPGELPLGANMAIRRKVFETLSFDPRLGPCESKQVRGEETLLLRQVRQAGGQGVWVGPARVRHYISAERLTAKYVGQWFRGLGRFEVRHAAAAGDYGGLGLSEGDKTFGGAPRWLLRKCWENRLTSWCLSPFKGPRWFQVFRMGAVLQGRLDELREASVGSSRSPRNSPVPAVKT